MDRTAEKGAVAVAPVSPVAEQESKNTNNPLGAPIHNEYTMLIGQRPKLYDLNKNYTNFEIEFQIDADTPDLRFFVHILPQDELDKTGVEDVAMKLVHGRISGKISNNNNVYQNYFIILKNAVDEEARVTIRTRTSILPVSLSPEQSSREAYPSSSAVVPTPSSPTSADSQSAVGATASPVGAGIRSWLSRPAVFYGVCAVVVIVIFAGVVLYYNSYNRTSSSSDSPDEPYRILTEDRQVSPRASPPRPGSPASSVASSSRSAAAIQDFVDHFDDA